MTGRLLSREINSAGAKTECPSLEEIAAFIDAGLEEPEREKIMGHLVCCRECYGVFSEALKSGAEMKRQSQGRIKRFFYYSIPAAAAAAVLVFIFKFAASKPETPLIVKNEGIKTEIPAQEKGAVKTAVRKSPPSSADIISALAKNTDIKALARYIKEPEASAFGFGGSSSVEQASFRIGVNLTDLEIALKAEDKKRSSDALKQMTLLLQNVKGSSELLSFCEDAAQKIGEGIPLNQLAGSNARFEKFFREKNEYLYLRFGEWTEGGRLAAIAGDREFFDAETVRYFIKNLGGKGLPDGVISSLKKMESVREQERPPFEDIERLLSDIEGLI